MKVISESKIKEAITGFLVNFPFFDGLNEEQLSIVAEHIDFYEMEKDEILFNEGDVGNCVYFIIEGELHIIKETLSANKIGVEKVIISTLSKGKSIGEMSVIDNIPRSATVKSRTKVRLVALSQKDFQLILEEHPRIGNVIFKGIARLLSLNLRKTSSRLADYMLPVS